MIQKYPCPCCGYQTYNEMPGGTYGICPVCFWEDDPYQLENPDEITGSNPVSLRQAQLNFKEFDACDRNMIKNVRQPTKDEQRDENWKPLDSK